ncbi:predicted protein [Chaetomium globosum CBS 148.51]|uniref:Uncharacterized protein n=1 Tax=Chaetomium globosum (strain ATCC 6205 / CBS 148.51 / DSM 1962 / NBRC 6347 / NRRL 1970) TaxID=306901 RepID=Q2H465_CHAGB|nr:uncharacterized protein CHGG_06550 [Chaetomium globosum CBS 148.51]EAQ89931.1 predicted protein [Chaetomium globosum CBS 148.51]
MLRRSLPKPDDKPAMRQSFRNDVRGVKGSQFPSSGPCQAWDHRSDHPNQWYLHSGSVLNLAWCCWLQDDPGREF